MTDLVAILIALGALPLFLAGSYPEAFTFMAVYNAAVVGLFAWDRSRIPSGALHLEVHTAAPWILGRRHEIEITLRSEARIPLEIDIAHDLRIEAPDTRDQEAVAGDQPTFAADPAEGQAGPGRTTRPVAVAPEGDEGRERREGSPGGDQPAFAELCRVEAETLALDALELGLGGGAAGATHRPRLRSRPAGVVEPEFPLAPDDPEGPEDGPSRPPASLGFAPVRIRLGSGEKRGITGTFTPIRRGRVAPIALHLRIHGPLGLAHRDHSETLGEPTGIVAPVDTREALGAVDHRPDSGDAGLLPSRRRGSGIELESLRPYVPGDEIRKVAWKATARRGSPIVRETLDEVGQQVMVMVDVGRSIGARVGSSATGKPFERVLDLALRLARAGIDQGDRVGLLAFASRVEAFLRPGRGRRQWNRLAREMQPLEPTGRATRYRPAVAHLLTRVRRRSSVILLTDLPAQPEIQDLAGILAPVARRHRLLVVALRDPLLDATLAGEPAGARQAYQASAAAQLMIERDCALDDLRGAGIPAVDLDAGAASLSRIQRWMSHRV